MPRNAWCFPPISTEQSMIWWVKIVQFLFQDISWRYSIRSLGSHNSVGSSQAFQRKNLYKAAILYHHPNQHGAIKALVIKQDLIDFLSEDEWPLPIMVVRAQQKSPRIKLGYASTFPGSTVQPLKPATGTWPRLVHTILQTQEFWFTPWRVAETLLALVHLLKREKFFVSNFDQEICCRIENEKGGHKKFMWISITKSIWGSQIR